MFCFFFISSLTLFFSSCGSSNNVASDRDLYDNSVDMIIQEQSIQDHNESVIHNSGNEESESIDTPNIFDSELYWEERPEILFVKKSSYGRELSCVTLITRDGNIKWIDITNMTGEEEKKAINMLGDECIVGNVDMKDLKKYYINILETELDIKFNYEINYDDVLYSTVTYTAYSKSNDDGYLFTKYGDEIITPSIDYARYDIIEESGKWVRVVLCEDNFPFLDDEYPCINYYYNWEPQLQ